MRPRLITAENPREHGGVGLVERASMRPRLITAENIEDLLLDGAESHKLQ